MRHLIESLEVRALLSGTTVATLEADQARIATDEAAAKSVTRAILAVVKTNDAPILANLKDVAPTINGPLLKQLKTAEAKAYAAITTAINALVRTANKVTNQSVAAGETRINLPSAPAQAKVNADIAVLQSALTTPLATVAADLASQTIDNLLTSLVAANPTDAALAALVNTRVAAADGQKTLIGAEAAQLHTDVVTLATDLGIIAITPPPLAPVFNGTGKVAVGADKGQVHLLLQTAISDSDGNVLGLTSVNADTVLALELTGTLTGKVTADDVFSGSILASNDGQITTISGTLVGKVLSGTFVTSLGSSGTFKLTHP